MPEIILTRIQRCHYCEREMSCPSLEYEQNPFCTVCLNERVAKAAPRDRTYWKREGNYVIAEVARKRPSSVNGPHRD